MDIKQTINDCINAAIDIALNSYNKSLDFSDESIGIVDEILDIYHDRYIHPEKDDGLIKERINTFAHIFGIYVGEVMVRNHSNDYSWQETEFDIALAKDEKNIVNPIAKAYKHIANGKESGDDIKSFFHVGIAIMKGKLPS